MVKKYTSSYFAFFASLILLCTAGEVQAASLSFSGASGTVGQTISVSILVSADSGESLNAVSAKVEYPTDKLRLLTLSKTGTLISFWTEEPNFSNASGVASLEGIIPNPGYSGQGGRVITLVFQAIAPGTSTLTFPSASILANDGKGSNILSSASSRSITIANAAPVTQEPAKSAPVATSAAYTTIITSATHPDPEAWYVATEGVFSWNVPKGATATRVLLDRIPNSVPSVVYTPAISSKDIVELPEGTSYLHIQHKIGDRWSGLGHFKINIGDRGTISPPTFTVSPNPVSAKGSVTVMGTGVKNADVDIYVRTSEGELVQEETTITDANGSFVSTFSPRLAEGTYRVSVQVTDDTGATSGESDAQTLMITSSYAEGIIKLLKEYLSDAVLLLLALIGFVTLVVYGWFKVLSLSHEAESIRKDTAQIVHKSFELLKKDLAEHAKRLHRAGNVRALTKEETEFLEEFSTSLRDAEVIIEDELRK